ncbi:MAG: NYN domain-containing protein [Clostridiales bacterium]|jgi:uncharacterized LabA/DUF88 family protein|nr:NYN domain-containing protein [Clostridiales bacterium]
MKTAVFYDLENMGLASYNGKWEEGFLGLQKKIKGSDLVGSIVLQKAYMRKNPSFSKIQPILEKHGVELVSVELVPGTNSSKTKNMVDFKMGIDITAIISRRHSIQTVVVASGDGDFGFLCRQIKEMGKNLLVVSNFSITGDVLLKLCDDWIDLSPNPTKPSFIAKAIDTRLTKKYHGMDFWTAFDDFLASLENDIFIKRYMENFGVSVNVFLQLLGERKIKLPNHVALGFANNILVLRAVLESTKFEIRNDNVRYNKNRKPYPRIGILVSILKVPEDYSREKLMHYYDILKGAEDFNEMMDYIEFMKYSGMLSGNELCQKRTFRATIRKHLTNLLKRAGLGSDEAGIKKISDKL